MKVLTIGMDRKLFEEGSPVRARNIAYGAHMEALHIVVYTLASQGFSDVQISPNVFLHPTCSRSRYFYIFDAIRLGKKIIRDQKFVRGASVVSAQDPFESAIPAWRIARAFNVPLHIQIHSDFFSPYFKNSLFNRIGVMAARFLIPRAQGIRVVSKRIGESLQKHVPQLRVTPHVLPIFVDVQKIIDRPSVPELRQQFSQFTFVIFMASRLTAEKEIETALYALAKILPDFPHTGLVIAGDGPRKKYLENLAEKLGIRAHVVFIGWQNDLIPYFKMAHLFLLTSRYEGYGMTLIEAGASGMPIITTSVGIAPELFTDGVNAYVCPVGDVSCVAGHSATLISDNVKRQLFKQAVQDTMMGIATSENQYVDQYVALLQGLL